MQKNETAEPTTPLSMPSDFVFPMYSKTTDKSILFSRLPHRALGDYGEMLAKRKFEASGYIVKMPPIRSKCGDLRVSTKHSGGRKSRIEVKTAQCGKNGKYRFCLSKGKHTNHCHSDYVLLVAIDMYEKEYFYLIPSFAIASITYISISNPVTYSGMYAKYRVHGQLSLTTSQEIALL